MMNPQPTPRHAPAPEAEARVLRVGLLHNGELKQETLLRPGQELSLGRSRRCALVVDDPALPRRLVLVELTREGPVLVLQPGMSGRVALPSGVHEIREARASERVRLDERSRGRVQIGSWTLLFQWVSAPPVPLRVPPSMRPSLIGDDDPVFAGSLGSYAAAALAFFVFLGQVQLPAEAMSIDQLDPRVVDLFRQISPPEPTPGELVDLGEQTRAEARRADARERRADREERRAERTAAREARDARSVEEQAAEAREAVLRLLGTHGQPGRPDVFAQSDDVGASMQGRLEDVGGVDLASNGPMGPRQGSGGRADAGGTTLGRSGPAEAVLGQGPAASVRTRVGAVETIGAEPGSVEGIKATIGRYTSAITGCYEQALRQNPELSGRLMLSISVTRGEVMDVAVTENTTGADEISRCAELRARTWTFDRALTADILAPFSLSR